MLRGSLLPASVLLLLGCLLIPPPPAVMDFLLISNLGLAVLLLLTAISIVDPVRLSTLPSLLLLTTIVRLTLNICSTRLIIATGDAGAAIKGFGSVVIQDNLLVGLLVFTMMSIIQFVVIAKGSERVAEVAARFTLDAMPGKQMSIDADVRAGLISFDQARSKRQELQTESRFYGALDGAMKFVKGDAIAGLLVAAINLVGGLFSGLAVEGLAFHQALRKYTVLTVGDGLLTQIPALMNALTAGLVVTRVVTDSPAQLSGELFEQLGQGAKARGATAAFLFAASFLPGMPTLACALVGGSLLLWPKKSIETLPIKKEDFVPRLPPLVEIRADPQFASRHEALVSSLDELRNGIYSKWGVRLPPFQISAIGSSGRISLSIRGVKIDRSCSSLEEFCAVVSEELNNRLDELLDDSVMRLSLAAVEAEFPEMVNSLIPHSLTLTQLTELCRQLVSEGIPIRNLDSILQAIAECGPPPRDSRAVLEKIRVTLKRLIVSIHCDAQGGLPCIFLDNLLDLALLKCEREGKLMAPHGINLIVAELSELIKSNPDRAPVMVASKGSRRILKEILEIKGIELAVLAHEEIVPETKIVPLGMVSLGQGSDLEVLFN